MDKFDSYRKAVGFLESLSNLPRDKDYMTNRGNGWIHLEKARILLDLLGNPEEDFKYIHVTGTAGKGSVSTLIHSALVASGKKAGLFTSPFATTTIEKFKVGNSYISPDEFAELTQEMKPVITKANLKSPWGPLSYFEIIFGLALLFFKNHGCEWAVVEVGCGGRYDITNTIPSPKAAVLTNVGYDHTEILGKTLNKIAFEKIGIVKKGSNFFTSEQRPRLLRMFQDVCKKEGAEFHWIKKQNNDYFKLNQELAAAVCRSIGLKDDDIKKGFSRSFLPCRFEIVQNDPIVILDGAHNEDKIKSTLHSLKNINYKKLHLVFALAQNKEISCILNKVIPAADKAYLTRFEMPLRKCADPAALYYQAEKIKKANATIEVFYDPWQALEAAMRLASKDDVILVTGSFFLSGRLREKWYPEEWILSNRRSR